jgi:2'-5' RNA ligase
MSSFMILKISKMKHAKDLENLFFALTFEPSTSQELYEQYSHFLGDLGRQTSGLRLSLVQAENIHLTLYFIGRGLEAEVKDSLLPNIKDQIHLFQDRINRELQTLRLKPGLTLLPNQIRPKALVLLPEDEKALVLEKMHIELSKLLKKLSFENQLKGLRRALENNQKFFPHITLARIRKCPSLAPIKNQNLTRLPILKEPKLSLFKSEHIGPKGQRRLVYRKLG